RPMLNSRQSQNGATGVLQKMSVQSVTATMELDLNRLNASSVAPQKQEQMRFDLAANSFFTILVFNDRWRGPEQGSMALMPAGVNSPGYSNLPVALGGSLSSSQSKNFLRANNSISPCATQKPASPFLISRDTSTITM